MVGLMYNVLVFTVTENDALEVVEVDIFFSLGTSAVLRQLRVPADSQPKITLLLRILY